MNTGLIIRRHTESQLAVMTGFINFSSPVHENDQMSLNVFHLEKKVLFIYSHAAKIMII